MPGEWGKAYALVKRIPKGKVITYGGLARAVKLPGGARAAGRAMAGCPKGRGIPWHRVVGAQGRILIREPYASLQRRLIESEGVQLAGGRVDLARCEWVPRPLWAPGRGSRRSVSSRPARNMV